VTPWRSYNQGVEAYAKGDYAVAFQLWQNLSIQKLPTALQRQVWFQLGNVQFHLGEPLEHGSPEDAAELWRRSCEAYRSVLRIKPRDREARHNLEFVQRRLALLTHRLGMEAFRATDGKDLDTAIDLLRTSTGHLEEAANLSPEDLQIALDRTQVVQTLRQRLKDRAEAVETKGDDYVRQTNSWADDQAEAAYEAALQDLGDAGRPSSPQAGTSASHPGPDALEQSVAEAENRVHEKLSQLLTRKAKSEQKQGNEQEALNPDQALAHYENALDLYRAAQEAQPSNVEAKTGEREVRLAMEKLYVREGTAELQRGKDALKLQSPRAAEALSTALSHYESALQLNEHNTEARNGAGEARRLLPEALVLAGNAELKAGERAEPQSATEALSRYQEAEKDFQQSLELEPGQPSAKKGLREVEEKLARVRKKAAEEAEIAALAGQPQSGRPKSLESLLGLVEERERQPESDRRRQRGQRNTGPGKSHGDW
jgi:tetratricopeptide (TPR) repeat protein